MKNKSMFTGPLLFTTILMLFYLPVPSPQRSLILRKQMSLLWSRTGTALTKLQKITLK